VAIHRAVVEVFAALATTRPLKKLPYPQPGTLLDETKDVQVLPTDDGMGATLRFPSSEIQQVILQWGSSQPATTTVDIPGLSGTESLEGNTEEEEATVAVEQLLELNSMPQVYTTESLRETINTWGRGWLHVKLLHPVIKFAVSHLAAYHEFRESLDLYVNIMLMDIVGCTEDSTTDWITYLGSPHPPNTVRWIPCHTSLETRFAEDSVSRAGCR